ncbi:MAG: ArsR family transcriptional regulator [Syntrophobacteraceae bacterium]
MDTAAFEQTLRAVCEAEYQNGLILELLRSGPKTVREICAATGIAVKDVSKRLVDVEKMGVAELSGYEGSSPRFIRTAA